MFADKGFAAATVRDICDQAEANVAAVNYHYGDKIGLYRAVFRHAAGCCSAEGEQDPGAAGASPAERLRWWVSGFLGDLVAKDVAGWPARLMARELAEPSAVLDEYIDAGARPRYELLLTILSAAHPGIGEADLRRSAASVIGQVIFYHHGKPFIARLSPTFALTAEAVEAIADHITRFSLAGLAARSRP